MALYRVGTKIGSKWSNKTIVGTYKNGIITAQNGYKTYTAGKSVSYYSKKLKKWVSVNKTNNGYKTTGYSKYKKY